MTSPQSSALQQTSFSSNRQNATLLATAGALAGAVQSLHNNLHQGSLLVDPYWTGFYLANYQDGFRRRALLGSVLRMASPHGINVLVINALAVLVVLLLVGLLIRAYGGMIEDSSLRTRLFLFAFFASVLASIFFETLGDPLQIAFTVFLAGIFATRVFAGKTVRMLVALLLTGLAFLIHEAAIFFLVPALPFFIAARPRPKDFLAPCLLFGALLGLSMHWSHVQPHLTYQAILIPRQAVLTEPVETPDFATLIHTEARNDFGSLHAVLHFGSECCRILVILMAGLIAVFRILPRPRLQRFLPIFAAILLFNVPLWFIAHDWGRFLTYTFFFAAIATALDFQTGAVADSPPVPPLTNRFIAFLERIASIGLIELGAIFVLFDSPGEFTRITGIGIRPFVAFLGILAILLLSTLRNRSRPQPAA